MIYTVCQSLFDFRLKPLFVPMDISVFKEKSISETQGSNGSYSEMGIVWKYRTNEKQKFAELI